MKTFLLLAFSLTTALTHVARAEDPEQFEHKHKRSDAPANRPTVVTQAPRVQPNANVPQQAPVYKAPQTFSIEAAKRNARMRSAANQDWARSTQLQQDTQFTPRVRNNPRVFTPPVAPTTTDTTQFTPRVRNNPRVFTPPVAPTTTDATVQTNVNTQDRVDRTRRTRTDNDWQQNNWRNHDSNTVSWSDARRRHDRHHHDRNWWRSRYSRFALFGAGYYFWDSGYWYPAYGYDSYYNRYEYNEPIYGYNDMDPTQVIASVQTQLQRLGYYRLAVDGLMGPGTRAAIANFQRDNGLSITAAIDRPTLSTLGLG